MKFGTLHLYDRGKMCWKNSHAIILTHFFIFNILFYFLLFRKRKSFIFCDSTTFGIPSNQIIISLEEFINEIFSLVNMSTQFYWYNFFRGWGWRIIFLSNQKRYYKDKNHVANWAISTGSSSNFNLFKRQKTNRPTLLIDRVNLTNRPGMDTRNIHVCWIFI